MSENYLDSELAAMKFRCENYDRRVPHHCEELANDSKRLQSLVVELRREIAECDEISFQMGNKARAKVAAQAAEIKDYREVLKKICGTSQSHHIKFFTTEVLARHPAAGKEAQNDTR